MTAILVKGSFTKFSLDNIQFEFQFKENVFSNLDIITYDKFRGVQFRIIDLRNGIYYCQSVGAKIDEAELNRLLKYFQEGTIFFTVSLTIGELETNIEIKQKRSCNASSWSLCSEDNNMDNVLKHSSLAVSKVLEDTIEMYKRNTIDTTKGVTIRYVIEFTKKD